MRQFLEIGHADGEKSSSKGVSLYHMRRVFVLKTPLAFLKREPTGSLD